MKEKKKFDVICMGRIAVDLYGQQIGSRLEDMGSFAKYLGGSSGNVAYGCAVQGLRSSMLARVGDEHMGRFLREQLQRVGCDTSHLVTDKERLTALAILGIKDRHTFPLIFYRENCADMAIAKDDFSESYIASARCLAITGTHLSHPRTREAVLTALEYARRNAVKTVLDIDYRPVLWGLTSLGDGETRYIASDAVTGKLQEVLPLFDLVVGTEEEFHIAAGSTDTIEALRTLRRVAAADFILKRGTFGAAVYTGEIPDTLDEGLTVTGVRVEVLNVLGAGDAFMSGLLRGYLGDEGWERTCTYANACGALVVSRHGCAPAMPSRVELDDYLTRAPTLARPDLDERLAHLHRVTTRGRHWQELCVMAFDHRSQFVEMALAADSDIARIETLKKRILQAARQAAQEADLNGKAGLLCDSTFGQEVLDEITGEGWWIGRPIELPGSRPLVLEHGNIGSQLRDWPLEQVVKCLVFFDPRDEHRLRLRQEHLIDEVYHACCQSGHQLLLEVVLPPAVEKDDALYLRAIERFYNLRIRPDWWKLPPLAERSWQAVSALIEARDPYCCGVLILGLDATWQELARGFAAASRCDKVKGFAVGRTLFAEPARLWLARQIDDAALIEDIKSNYHRLITLWRRRGESGISQEGQR